MIYTKINSHKYENKFYYLYDKYNNLLYKYAYYILENHFDTEDALQISWFKISNNMEKIEKQTERKAVNFMITITKNSAIDIYNKRTGNLIEDTSIDEIADNELEGIYMDIGINEIKEAVKMLSDDYVKVLLLKFTYGYSIKEIAKFLYVSEANVGTRIYRAKNSIKKFILNIKNR